MDGKGGGKGSGPEGTRREGWCGEYRQRDGRGWAERCEKDKGLGILQEGLWCELAWPCLFSAESQWKPPQTTKPGLSLGCRTGVDWQARAFSAPRSTFLVTCACLLPRSACPPPSMCVSLRVTPCACMPRWFAQVFPSFLEVPVSEFPVLPGYYR